MQRVNILVLTKAVTYDEWPKMKRDTRQKSSPFPEKKTAFLSGISLHFRLFVVLNGSTYVSNLRPN